MTDPNIAEIRRLLADVVMDGLAMNEIVARLVSHRTPEAELLLRDIQESDIGYPDDE
jgi:hypothetical protein